MNFRFVIGTEIVDVTFARVFKIGLHSYSVYKMKTFIGKFIRKIRMACMYNSTYIAIFFFYLLLYNTNEIWQFSSNHS